MTLHPRRVNLTIGQPNVDKSSILEAMSLLGMFFDKEGGKFMEGQIRYEDLQNLFYDNELIEQHLNRIQFRGHAQVPTVS